MGLSSIGPHGKGSIIMAHWRTWAGPHYHGTLKERLTGWWASLTLILTPITGPVAPKSGRGTHDHTLTMTSPISSYRIQQVNVSSIATSYQYDPEGGKTEIYKKNKKCKQHPGIIIKKKPWILYINKCGSSWAGTATEIITHHCPIFKNKKNQHDTIKKNRRKKM